jgi:hypothetical protein
MSRAATFRGEFTLANFIEDSFQNYGKKGTPQSPLIIKVLVLKCNRWDPAAQDRHPEIIPFILAQKNLFSTHYCIIKNA